MRDHVRAHEVPADVCAHTKHDNECMKHRHTKYVHVAVAMGPLT